MNPTLEEQVKRILFTLAVLTLIALALVFIFRRNIRDYVVKFIKIVDIIVYKVLLYTLYVVMILHVFTLFHTSKK
jgi:hypothetical protein